MEDARNIQAVSSPTDNPRHWLTAYFRTRAHLASHESAFHCDPACTRPGCKNNTLLIPVSIVDLLGAALHQHTSVFTCYQRHCILGLISSEPHAWLRKVALRLHKPCPFLEHDLCRIYPVRPLACILFPEYLVCEGRFAAEAVKAHFRDFLCLQRPLSVSPQRAAVVGKLKKMWERETLISNFYLFNHGHCYLDFGNLTHELLQLAATLRNTGSVPPPESPDTVSNQVLEHVLHQRLAGCPTFEGIDAKIDRLDGHPEQVRFLQLLQDDRLLKKLLTAGDDRDLIFRFVKGKLRRARRSLLPDEYKFL